MVSSMFAPIKLIIAQGVPAKIYKGIIQRFAIIMAGLHPGRTRTDECFKDKPVNQNPVASTFSKKNYREIAAPQNWFKDRMRFVAYLAFTSPLSFWVVAPPERPDVPQIARFITEPTRNRQPNFLRFFRGIANMTISHGGSLLHRVIFGSEPYPCDNRGAARSFIARPWVAVNG
jgi:hypothetical protein